MTTKANSHLTAIAWVATNRAACNVAVRLIKTPLPEIQTLAAAQGVKVTHAGHQIQFALIAP